MANLLSTLVGIPLTWIVLLAVQAALSLISGEVFNSQTLSMVVTFLAPALALPDERDATVSLFILLIFFFYVSAKVETRIIGNKLESYSIEPLFLKKAVWRANFYSYLFLGVFIAVWMMGVHFYRLR